MADQWCRSQGCPLHARWRCIIVMPKPPMKLGASDGDRERLDSGVTVCNKHRMGATVEQVLGPIGYEAIIHAFKLLKKKPPAIGDLTVDFQSLDFSRLDGTEVERIGIAQDEALIPRAPNVIDIRDAKNVKVISGEAKPDGETSH